MHYVWHVVTNLRNRLLLVEIFVLSPPPSLQFWL